MPSPIVISILANANQANATFNKTLTTTQKVGNGFRRMGGPATLALGAITAAGAKAADAAAEDAKAQVLLASAYRKSAGATDGQVAATERFIDKTARAIGVADDELRPALASLVKGSKSVKTAQEDLNIVLDVAADRNKSVTQVAAALEKGYGGNTAALGRLVPGLDKAILKSGDMNKITAELAKMTGGTAAKAAKTEAGQRARANIAMDESVETIGARLLPVYAKAAKAGETAANWLAKNEKTATALAAAAGGVAVAVLAVNAAMKVATAVTTVHTAVTKVLTAAQDSSTRSMVRNRVAVGGAGAALLALSASGKTGSGTLSQVATVAGSVAAGFAVAGPWGAVAGAGVSLIGLASKSEESAARQEKFLAIQQKITSQAQSLTSTLNEQTGAITANTRESTIKALADNGAFTAANKVGVSYDTVTRAALGNRAAQAQVTAATNAYVKRAVQAKDGAIAQSEAFAKAKTATEPLTGSVDKFSRTLGKAKRASDQARSAIKQMEDRARDSATAMRGAGSDAGEGFRDGIAGWLDRISDVGARIADVAAKAARDKLKTGSPSKVMREIGGFAGEGFAIGISDQTPKVVAAITDQVRRTTRVAEGMALPDFAYGASDKGKGLVVTAAGGRREGDTYYVTVKIDGSMTEAEQGRKFHQAIQAAKGQGLVVVR